MSSFNITTQQKNGMEYIWNTILLSPWNGSQCLKKTTNIPPKLSFIAICPEIVVSLESPSVYMQHKGAFQESPRPLPLKKFDSSAASVGFIENEIL